MTNVEALILGVLQGIAEFLPISSSGHLVIMQSVLGIQQPGNEFEIVVHLGTLASIIVVFFKDIKNILFSMYKNENHNWIYFIMIGTLPSIVVGLGFKNQIQSLFEDVFSVGIALIFTGVFLFYSRFFNVKNKQLSIFKSVVIGLFQSIAIIPGISRSGMTITSALFLGLNSNDAAKFSFLLAIPAITGAGIITMIDAGNQILIRTDAAMIGFISSFIVGVLSLKWLIKILEKGDFYYFGIYCLLLGLVVVWSC
tara:strand:- start:690 stop:1451 length:762 start_codon:yes stop_codon:yes gene_type:complete